ncbi:MAG: hypothetical protein M1828_004696 [Chrysothrix sp. TS-e1954]|nr:MAG: hypothetical protein M1828_004696 [Chrysothrix sp. TS-e1954]
MHESGADDLWVMVEDEFLSTAQTYTRHLHHAEYKRLQQEARQKPGDNKVQDNGATNERTGRREKVEEKVAKLDAEMDLDLERDPEKLWDSDQEQEQDILIADRNLAGLMFGTSDSGSVGKPKVSKIVGPPRSKTRAAAGFGKQVPPRNHGYRERLAMGRTTTVPAPGEIQVPRQKATSATVYRQNSNHETENHRFERSSRLPEVSTQNTVKGCTRSRNSSEIITLPALPDMYNRRGKSRVTASPSPKPPDEQSEDRRFDGSELHTSKPKYYTSRRSRHGAKESKEKKRGGIEEIPTFLG